MLLVVGRIGRPHGTRGDVTIEVRTDDPDARFAHGSELLTDPVDRGPLTIVDTGRSGQITLVKFDGIDDRGAAEQLRDTLLQVDTDMLPDLNSDNEFYDHQLVGLHAVDTAGRELGTVSAVLHAPAAPVLTVTRQDNSEELVPFVMAIVPTVDIAAGMITIDPPDGMFP